MRVLISTASSKTVVVAPNGCPDSITKYISECVDQRGGVFTNTSSSTWKAQGYYGILVEENLGINRTAFFGNDTISLGLPGSGGPTLENQVLGTTIAAEFSVGFFGVNPKPLNWTTMEHGQPSYITTLKEKNIIPSVSFGYTAGNQYRK